MCSFAYTFFLNIQISQKKRYILVSRASESNINCVGISNLYFYRSTTKFRTDFNYIMLCWFLYYVVLFVYYVSFLLIMNTLILKDYTLKKQRKYDNV